MIDRLHLAHRIHLCKADLLEIDLPAGCLDGAFSFELLEHIANLSKLHRNLGKWLKPSGRIHARTGANGLNVLKTPWLEFLSVKNRMLPTAP